MDCGCEGDAIEEGGERKKEGGPGSDPPSGPGSSSYVFVGFGDTSRRYLSQKRL